MSEVCDECGFPVYLNGEGVWISSARPYKYLCPDCAEAKLMREQGRRWDPTQGCWVPGDLHN